MTSPLERAQALLLADRPEQALAELAELSVVETFGPDAMWVRCAAQIRLRQWAQAAEAARAGLAAGGPEPRLLLWMGQAEHELGRPEAAERALLRGLELVPGDVHLLCAYAELCAAEGQPGKAAQLVERASAADPHAPVVFAARARVAYARGDDREAERISREFGASIAVRADPEAHAGTERPARDAVLDTRLESHPLMIPLWPLRRFDPLYSWLAWIVTMLTLRAADLTAPLLVLAPLWLLYCLYSWVVPPLLRRWLRRR
ncbi:tetratricopeptide repeat protein [Actinoplanes sp. NPDC026623]|uniref:tetratricopeptide repeat protein n=1 Tax=Actinoplanes sp. NPDC026623 TaxID=3155610 RepID=UPI0033CCEC4E